ncbi:MAG: YHS domain-containing protein, partial [Gammaproteobacteria bacterium]|nr:YHS domain-containing protein [Gammaproteobacteria bacterium]
MNHPDHPTDSPQHPLAESGPGAGAAPPLKDPVCGMSVSTESPHQLAHDGRTFYFCSAKCQSKFGA